MLNQLYSLTVRYGSSPLLELALFLLTCVIVFTYASFTNARPKTRLCEESCSKTQQCVEVIHQLCQNRSTLHKGLQMYLEHKDHFSAQVTGCCQQSWVPRNYVARSYAENPTKYQRKRVGFAPRICLECRTKNHDEGP